MKKLFSKKSGFTLVEIIVAFAVFSIMATMIIQILNLTIQRRTDNYKYDQKLQNQEQTLVAKGQTWAYDDTKGNDGTLSLQFKDQDGNDMPMELNYQLKSPDGTVGEVDGLNYFVGQIDYADGFEGSEYTPDDPNADPLDPSDIGGGSQMDRFDTRITGTKGITSVTVAYTYDAGSDEYTFNVTVNDSGITDYMLKTHSQVTLFFGEGTPGGKLATVKEVNGGTKDQNTLKYVKKCGANGVNIHCNGSGFNGTTTTFRVKFNEPISDLGFGSNASGNTYTMYNGYANIYGAYEKASS